MINYKKIKLEDKTRSYAWIKEAQDEGRLYINTLPVSDKVFKEFTSAIKIVEDVYSGKWDLEIDSSDTILRENKVDIKAIIIHFPLINITNKDSLRHTIKDLYVRIPLYLHGRLCFSKLEGGRSTLSYMEYCSNYFHSHLSMNSYDTNLFTYFTTFCTGSGEINAFQMQLNADGFDETIFTNFLIQLYTLVSYESIEGRPYRYIRNITLRTRGDTGFRMPNISATLGLLNRSKIEVEDNTVPDLNFKITTKYELLDDEKFSKFLLKGANSDLTIKKHFLCYADPTGMYYNYSTNTGRSNEYIIPTIDRTYEFIFQGKVVPFIVEDIPEQIDNSNIEYIIHPVVRNRIKQKIEDDINKIKIRQSTIERYQNRSGDARKGTKSDTVLMPTDS